MEVDLPDRGLLDQGVGLVVLLGQGGNGSVAVGPASKGGCSSTTGCAESATVGPGRLSCRGGGGSGFDRGVTGR